MLKLLRVVGLYIALSFAFLVLGMPLIENAVGTHMALTFFGPVLPVWLNERRIKKKRDLVEAEEFVARINNDKLAIREQVEKHLPALSRNMRKAVRINDYGATASDERNLVVAEFLASTGVVLQQMSLTHAMSYIESLLEAEKTVRREETQFDPSLIPSNGYDFEHWVAEALEQFGWDARATQGSGDQGVDVIASREGLSLGIQCKLYSAAVGNKAVQEAFAGAKHMGLDKAAVLTNAAFTQSAKDLAASTGVLLLSPYDIPTLAEQFK
jgi:restriction system protein